MECAISIGAKIAEYGVAPVGRQFGYLLCYSCNVEELKGEVDNLEAAKTDVQGLVDDAERNGEVIQQEVREWLKRAGKITEESKKFLQDEDELDKRCFKGLCPNLKVRHQRSREAKKKSASIDELKKKRNFDRVSYPAPPPRIGSTSNEDAVEVFGSRKLTSKEIMEALKDDQITMIGVYGTGGIGKTTLVKEVAKQVKDDYDKVLMAVVSQNPDFKNIQGEIADMLGLKFTEETISGRAQRLHAQLKEKRILLILDDVWTRLELDTIGIPICRNHKGCKILFTSRSVDVCNEMGTQKNISVGVLSESEALALFKKMVGESVETPDLRPLAAEVAKECSGLPIAIVTVARALKDKDLSVWRDALKRLRKSITSDTVFSTLRLSYDFLVSEEMKTFFLLTCLFPEDCNIAIQDLMKYGMGLGLFKEVENLDDAIDRSITLAYYLKSSCLLLDGSDQNRVKVHDVVRDVAISIASKDEPMFLVRAGPEWKEWPKNELFKCYTAISLMSQDISKLPDGLECPQLKLLLLKCNHPSLHFPNNFFSRMNKLEVLDMSSMRFSQLPQSLQCLKQLRTLRLDFCKLEDISIIGELNNLEVLSFLGSNIEVLPKEIGKLSQLRLLDLTQCYSLKIIAPEAIQGLSQLEGLYMIDSFKEWEVGRQEKERSNASLSDLKPLLHLIALEIYIPEPEFLPDDLIFGNLLRYRISIGTPIDSWDPTSYSKFLKLKVSVPLKDGVNILLKTAELIKLENVKGLKYVLSDLDRERFLKLKCLEVYECDNVECIVNTGQWISDVAFPVLEELNLFNLKGLKEICHGQLPRGFLSELQVLVLWDLPGLIGLWKDPAQHVSLCNLRVLKVRDCNRLKSIFPSSTAKNLSKLRKLKVSDCKVMETIFECEGEEASALRVEILLPHLRSLRLENLPSLTCFLSNIESLASNRICGASTEQPLFSKKVSFPELEKLHLIGLENLRLIWPSHFPTEDMYVPATLTELRELKLWMLPKLMHLFNENSHQTYSLSNLCSLDIYKCGSLKHVFSTSMAIGLSQLQTLEVDSCAMMKEIMANENKGKEEAPGKILLPLVDTLQLKNLQELMSFCKGSYTAEFPSLISLEIKYCPKIQALLSSVRPSSPKLDNLEIPTQALFNGKVVFPTLEKLMINNAAEYEGPVVMDGDAGEMLSQLKCLELSALPKLKSIWPSKNPEKVSFSALEVLILYELDNLGELWHPQIPASSFPQLKVLQVTACHELLSVVPPNTLVGLKNLEELTIIKCELVEKIFELDRFVFAEEHAEVVLPKLKKLILGNLPKLEKIWSDTHPHQLPGFQNLSFLEIYECHGLKSLFTTSSARFLEKLEEINITSCKMMEAIVTKGIIDQNPLEAITFPRVHTLKLRNLPELKSFYTGSCAFKWPALRCLQIVDCYKMSRFSYRSLSSSTKVNTQDEVLEAPEDVPIEPPFHGQVSFSALEVLKLYHLNNLGELWHPQIPASSFPQLKVLQVTACHELSSVVPPNTLVGLKNLEELTIKECKLVEKIFELDRFVFAEEHAEVVLPKLKKLILWNLPKLEKIWSDTHPHQLPGFQNLSFLEIYECDGLKSLCTTSSARFLEKLEEVNINSCKMMEAIVTKGIIDQNPLEALTFPRVHTLKLRYLPELTSFYTGSCAFKWPALACLWIVGCPKMSPFANRSLSSSTKVNTQDEVLEAPEDVPIEPLFHGQVIVPVLKEVMIDGLENLKQIWKDHFPSQFEESSVEQGHLTGWFSHLETLVLCYLPKLMKIGWDTMQHSLQVKVIFSSLDTLKLYGLDSLEKIWSPEVLAESYPKLRILEVGSCNKLSTVIPFNMLKNLENLEELTVQSCDSVEMVFELQKFVEEGHVSLALPKLSGLVLSSLPNLRGSLWDNSQHQILDFPKLQWLNVYNCQNLSSLFTPSAAHRLVRLEEAVIDSCEKMEAIVSMVSRDENPMEVVELPRLRTLQLTHLPKLTSFNRGSCALKWPTLRSLEIADCPQMQAFTSEFHSNPSKTNMDDEGSREIAEEDITPVQAPFDKQVAFPFLEVLQLSGLDSERWLAELLAKSFPKLRVLKLLGLPKSGPSNMLSGLQNLEELSILDCESIEKVFEFEGLVEEGHATTTPPISIKLNLQNLPNLCEIWGLRKSPNQYLVLPMLTTLNVYQCNNLRNLFTKSTVCCLLQLQQLNIDSCEIIKTVIADDSGGGNLREVFKFTQMHTLKLVNLPGLESFSTGTCSLKFPTLNCLEIRRCPEMKTFTYRSLYPWNPHTIDDGFEEMPEQSSHCIPKLPLFDKQTSFNSLEKLRLNGLKKMKEIWHKQLPAESFGRLRDLQVERCDNIVKVVPCNLLPGLQNLESFSLSECAMVEEVFEFVGIHVGEGHPSLSLFELKKLMLCKLPKLMQMCWNKKLRGIVGFPNLHELRIIKCDALKNIFFHSVAKSFVNLQSLYVNDCLIMEEIVANEEKEDARGKSVFPLLKCLELKDLPNFKSFCLGSYTFNWPQLKRVMLDNCPEMQKFSLGFLCTPVLNTVNVGNKNMWKGDLNSTVQHLFEAKDVPIDEGSSGGVEKEEDEQSTQSSNNEVSGEKEKNTANPNISGVANEGEVLQGPIEQHQEKGEGKGVIPLSNANQDNTDSKPSPQQLASSENLRSQDDGPTPTTSKYPISSQLIPQNVTEISSSQSPPQQHLPMNTPTSSQSIPDNVTQTLASKSPLLHLSLNTPTSSQLSPINVTQIPASQSPQLHLSMTTPKQVENCTPIVSALLTSHPPIPKTSSIPESGSSRTSAEQESIIPPGIVSPSQRLSHKISQPKVAILYESSLVEDQPNLLDTRDVKLPCSNRNQASSQTVGETSSQGVVPSCFFPEISSHPFSDLVLKGLFKDFSSVTLPTRLKEKVTTASDPPPVKAPNDEWCEVQLRYPWFTSVLAQFPQHLQIVTFYELVESSKVLLMLRSLSLGRLHLLDQCFHKYEDFGFNCKPFLSIVSSAIQIKQAEQSLLKLNRSLDDQRHNHKERVEFLELSQSLRTEIHELEEEKHQLKQELAHVTAKLGSREQILHELDICYQKMGEGEIVLAETEEDMQKTEEAIAIYSLQLQTAKSTLENAGF